MNLTTTNYLFPTKEGRFQRWRRLSFCPPCGMGAAARCEGRCPSGAGRQTWLLLPEVGGLRPHAPHREGAPPHTPGVYAGLAAPAPTMRALRPAPRGFLRGWQPQHPPAGAPREHGKAMLGTRVTFPSRGKSPKARQGLRPLESPRGTLRSPCGKPQPPR